MAEVVSKDFIHKQTGWALKNSEGLNDRKEK